MQEDYRDFDTVEDCFLSSHLSIRRVSIEFASEGTVFEATAASRSLPPRIKTRPSCQRRERPSTKLTGHGTHILSPRITFITILISLGYHMTLIEESPVYSCTLYSFITWNSSMTRSLREFIHDVWVKLVYFTNV